MTTAREEILDRVRRALRDVPHDESATDVPLEWAYGRPVEVGDVLDTFVDRIIDYKAAIVRCPAVKVPQAIREAAQKLQIASAVVPVGLPAEWQDALRASGVEVRVDRQDAQLTNAELNQTTAVVTAAAVAAAQTGTIILDHSADQGRRALSLVPDVHLCVVRADQVVSGVPEAVARVKAAVMAGQPLTWISGGSATSDIELSRVEGVHGPRKLHVILAE